MTSLPARFFPARTSTPGSNRSPGVPSRSSRSRPAETRRIRRSLTALLAGSALLLSGCSRPLPEVSFLGGGSRVQTGPLLWCATNSSADALNCLASKSDAGASRMTLGPGQGMSINVPETVGIVPWVVVFRYRTQAGKQEQLRSELFSSDARLQYELALPAPTDQLLRVEVQSALTPMATATGSGVDYAALRTWVILIAAG